MNVLAAFAGVGTFFLHSLLGSEPALLTFAGL
jgi:hypothetical protein